MSIFRRRLMMQAKGHPLECPYITDGLVFWLDGINKGKSSEGWQDLISKKVFPWITRATPTENGVSFASGTTVLENDGTTSVSASDVTVEACCSNSFNSQYQVIFYDGNLMFARDSDGTELTYKNKGAGSTGGRYVISVPSTFTASANDDLALVGNVKSTTKANTDWLPMGSYIRIGGRSPGGGAYPYVGTVHSIRLYNRKLTEEEMLFNHQVDNERFNLGLEL